MDFKDNFDFNLLKNEVLLLAFKLLDTSDLLNKYYSEEEVLQLITAKDFEAKFNLEFANMDERIKRVDGKQDSTRDSGFTLRGKGILSQFNAIREKRKEMGLALSEIETLREDYFKTLLYLIDTELANFNNGKPITFECINNETGTKSYLTCMEDTLFYEHANQTVEVLYSLFNKEKYDKIFGKTQELKNNDDWDK